ncbi:MAG: flagella assembly protein FlgT middle domain-containing protein [Methylococcales bacterium]|nr:flagella assembly protein FlgT middle domain-containing protein [Methylococcales bacterium]
MPTTPPPSQVIISEGQAELGAGGRLLARKQALQDAIKNASLGQQALLLGRTDIANNQVMFDLFTLRTAAAVNSTTLLDEWQEGPYLNVRARVELSHLQQCPLLYRKRLVATAFPLAHAEHVSAAETTDLSQGLSRELLNQLTESGEFIGINRTSISLYPSANNAPEPPDYRLDQVNVIRQMATDSHAQLVLSGIIRDLQIEPNLPVSGADPWQQLKSVTRKFWRKRSLAIDIFVHDGLTGALLAQFRYQDQISGDFWLPKQYPLGGPGITTHALGDALSALIRRATQDIRAALRCYPFTARIIRIEPPDRVFIDAGAQEGLQVGDQLVVYHDQSGDLYLNNQQEYIGPDPQPATVMTLTDVKPRYARGRLDAESYALNLKTGGWVKAW